MSRKSRKQISIATRHSPHRCNARFHVIPEVLLVVQRARHPTALDTAIMCMQQHERTTFLVTFLRYDMNNVGFIHIRKNATNRLTFWKMKQPAIAGSSYFSSAYMRNYALIVHQQNNTHTHTHKKEDLKFVSASARSTTPP